jgi:hypothetical protein
MRIERGEHMSYPPKFEDWGMALGPESTLARSTEER